MERKNKFLLICVVSLKCIQSLHNQFLAIDKISSAKLGWKHVQGLPNLEAQCYSQHGKFQQKIHNYWKMCTPNLETRLSAKQETLRNACNNAFIAHHGYLSWFSAVNFGHTLCVHLGLNGTFTTHIHPWLQILKSWWSGLNTLGYVRLALADQRHSSGWIRQCQKFLFTTFRVCCTPTLYLSVKNKFRYTYTPLT